MRYGDKKQTVIVRDDGAAVPCDPDNADYAAILASRITVAPWVQPSTDDASTREYERRLFAILEARDLALAAFIRADDDAELREPRILVTPSAADVTRNSELKAVPLAGAEQ